MASKLLVSGKVSGDFTCKWIIKDCKSLDFHFGKLYKSNVFQIDENGKEWQLGIYPGGRTENERGKVSCVLYGATSEHDSKWQFRISLEEADGKSQFDGKDKDLVEFSQDARGHAETIPSEHLLYPPIADVLVVILEATYAANSVDGVVGAHRRAESISVRDLSDDWGDLWTSGHDTDGFITVGGEDVPVHTLVLRTRSNWFDVEFKRKDSEKSPLCVAVDDFDMGTVKSLLEFIYTGRVLEMSYHLALELLRAGDKYRVNNLESYSAGYLMSLVSSSTACQILASADNVEELRRLALNYICLNLTERDLEAHREVFMEKPAVLWRFFKQFVKERRSRGDY